MFPKKINFKSESSNFDYFVFILLLISYSIIPLFVDYNWISTYFIFPFTFFLLVFRYGVSFLLFDIFFLRILLIIIIGIIISIEIANYDFFIKENLSLVGVLLSVGIICIYVKSNPVNIFKIYYVFILKFLLMLIYSYNLGFDYSLFNEYRIKTGKLYGINSNAYSYFAFFAIFYSSLLLQAKRNAINKFLFILIICVGLFVSIITSSRAGLFFVLISSILNLWVLFKNKIPFFILISLLVSLVISNFSSDISQSITFNRFFEFYDSFEDERIDILNIGIDLFFTRPIGYGPGQFTHLMLFSELQKYAMPHNTFLLIAVNYGIFGLIILLSIFYNFFKKNLLLFNSKFIVVAGNTYIFLFFIITFLLYNFFYDFIMNLYLFSGFYSIYIHQLMVLSGKFSNEV